MTIELNSKQYVFGNRDLWWYNISTPAKLTHNDVIILNLYDTNNRILIRKVILNLNQNNWLHRIKKSSTHNYRGTEICKIHIKREHGTNQFKIWFGNVDDGLYPV